MRIGVAGTGRWGSQIVRVLDDYCLVETFDPNRDSSCESFRELLAVSDQVVVAPPPHLHARMVLQAVAMGVPTFVEKPLALRWRDALEVQACDVPVAVGHIVLPLEGFQKFRTSRPEKIYASRTGVNPGYHGVGAWWDLAVHDVAVCVDLLGRPDRVDADVAGESYSAHLVWSDAEAYLTGDRDSSGKRWEFTIDGVDYSPYDEQVEPLRQEVEWWLAGGENLSDAVTVVETLERA